MPDTRGRSRGMLAGPDLTWYRITSRDARPDRGHRGPLARSRPIAASARADGARGPADRFARAPPLEEDAVAPTIGVADWRDSARFPTLSRDLLEEASGITIPSSEFVLKVILAYLIAVVPLNWLICRFVLNRREWAWVVVPLVALASPSACSAVAAYDMGFDSASDEIDLLEVHGDYPRAHLTRFASLYTTGRANYTISYPNNNTALALPLDNGRSIRGEDVSSVDLAIYAGPGAVGLLRPAAQPVDVPGRGDGDLDRLDPPGGGRREPPGGQRQRAGAPRRDAHRRQRRGSRAAEGALPGDDRRRGDRWRSARTAAANGPGADRGGPGSRPEPVPRGRADDLGAPRRELRARSGWSPGCRGRCPAR